MKSKIRNMYPGGNTPEGFYSYYNYILPQRKAEKIFCIKGGPGVGKSTLMKRIGEHFMQKGEAIDYLWCSSDPDSLDGILLRDRNIAIIDGTAPHVVDPKNPGAVDEVVDLGGFWDEAELKKNKEEIIHCNEKTAETFDFAYDYLKSAACQYRSMTKILDQIMSQEAYFRYRHELEIKVGAISAVKRAENSITKKTILGNEVSYGTKRKAFASAITPAGIKNHLDSLSDNKDRIIVLDVPLGFRTEQLLVPVSERLIRAGFDVEEYYCPMDPIRKIEHIVSQKAGLMILSSNDYHDLKRSSSHKKVSRIRIDSKELAEGPYGELYRKLKADSNKNIAEALTLFKEAKALHDELEHFYITTIDFKQVNEIGDRLIERIEMSANEVLP